MVMEAARENRLLIGKGGMFGNVIRISPPMNIGRADVDQFLEILDRSLAAAQRTLMLFSTSYGKIGVAGE